MRFVIASILLTASTASAGTYDSLLGAETCYAGVSTAVSLPDADGVHTVAAGTEPTVTLDYLGAPLYSGRDGKITVKGVAHVPSWCAAKVNVKLDSGTETLVMSTFYVASGADQKDTTINYNNDAAMWSVPVGNDAVAQAGTPPALSGPDEATDASQLVASLTSTKKLAALASKTMIVVGSAPDELFQGAKAKKILGKWNLDLAVDPHVVSGKDADYDAAWVIANVTATPHGKKGATAITYRVLYGLYRTKNKKWHLGLVHFALVK